MDSKSRHELEKNELAKWITHQYEDWIHPNKSWLGYAVCGLLVVIAIIFTTTWLTTQNRNAEWKDFYTAFNSEDANAALALVADSTSSIVGSHARLALAHRQRSEGSAEISVPLPDKSRAIAHLEKAIASYQLVQKSTSDLSLLQQAGYGLGQCWETLAAVRVGDDLAKAEEEYRKVAARWGDSLTGQRAQKQLALLQQPATRVVLERMATKVMPASTADWRVNIDPSDVIFPGALDLDQFEQEPTPPDTESDK